jgi:alpha-tubulin suppressor-like RCC1 family protein
MSDIVFCEGCGAPAKTGPTCALCGRLLPADLPPAEEAESPEGSSSPGPTVNPEPAIGMPGAMQNAAEAPPTLHAAVPRSSIVDGRRSVPLPGSGEPVTPAPPSARREPLSPAPPATAVPDSLKPGGQVRVALGVVVVGLVISVVAATGLRAGSQGETGAAGIRTQPVRVDIRGLAGDADATRIGVGDHSACLLTVDGRVACWGSNAAGELGRAGGDAERPEPIDTTGAMDGAIATRITVADRHACVADESGRAFCWGANDRGQLGSGSTAKQSDTPVQVELTGVLEDRRLRFVTSGGDSTCALDREGAAFCWGANESGQLGDGSTADSPVPVAVDHRGAMRGKKIVSLAAGDRHVCAVDSEGSAYCWGANDYGQLGTGLPSGSAVPVPVDLSASGPLAGVSAGGSSTCGSRPGSTSVCWGAGGEGQLGNGGREDALIPVAVLTLAERLNVGGRTACAIDAGGAVTCWGANDQGQLGNGSTDPSTVPIAVLTPPSAVSRVNSGSSTTCAIDAEGAAWCWGSDADGLLGDGSRVS